MANDVSSSMPQMDLRDNTILTVSLDDAGARITKLVVHGWQTVDDLPASSPSPVSGAYTTGGGTA